MTRIRHVVAATAAVLSATAYRGSYVLLSANAGNTGKVYIGTSNAVTTSSTEQGMELAAGASIYMPCDNTSQLWLIGTANDIVIAFVFDD